MNNGSLLAVAGMIIIPFLIVYLSIFIGHRYGSYHKKRSPDLQEGPVGTVVASAFALLAFMLAFTFQIATNKYDARKQLLAGIFALVMFLIFALDRPETGMAKLNQRPMITLHHQLQKMQSTGNN